MEQIIVGVLALVALCWAVHGRPEKLVPARVSVAQRVLPHRRRNHF